MKGLTGRVRPSWSPCLKWKAHSVSRWPDPRLTWPMSFFDDTEWSSRGNIPFNRQNTLLIIDLPTLTLVFGCYLVSYFQVLGRRYISKNRYNSECPGKVILVGGCKTHLKNMLVNMGIFPKHSGWKLKTYLSCHHLWPKNSLHWGW